jgi:hypothetical protein
MILKERRKMKKYKKYIMSFLTIVANLIENVADPLKITSLKLKIMRERVEGQHPYNKPPVATNKSEIKILTKEERWKRIQGDFKKYLEERKHREIDKKEPQTQESEMDEMEEGNEGEIIFYFPDLLKGEPGNRKEIILDMLEKNERERRVGKYNFTVNKKPDGKILIRITTDDGYLWVTISAYVVMSRRKDAIGV